MPSPSSSVSAMELHGTGTPLGDPIEIGAAVAVLADKSRRQLWEHPGGAHDGVSQQVWDEDLRRPAVSFSAIKSKMGHSEAGAGVMGLAHAILAIGARWDGCAFFIGSIWSACLTLVVLSCNT